MHTPKVLGLTAAVAALLVACQSGPSSSQGGSVSIEVPDGAASVSGGQDDIRDTIAVAEFTPSTEVLNVTGDEKITLFSIEFPMGTAGERRVIRSAIVSDDVDNRLYLGQEIICSGPSGQEETGIQTGENFVKGTERQAVMAQFTLEADEAGSWTCVTQVRVCVPGQCSSKDGSGSIDIATIDEITYRPTELTASNPLPDWASTQRPGSDPLIIQSGSADSFSATFEDVPLDQGGVMLMGTISLSNCIEASYPSECAKVKDRDLKTDSTVVPTFVISQLGGDNCPSITLNGDQGAHEQTITWQQHHGTFWFISPNMELDPNCKPQVRADLTFEVTDGNGIVVERGTASSPTSVVSIAPARPE